MTVDLLITALLENDPDPEEDFDIKKFIMQRPEPKSIAIVGRRWFRRGYGGTYHTARIYIDGQLVHTTPYQYGYGDQYLETGTQWLEQEGYIPTRPRGEHSGGTGPGWQWIRDKLGIPLEYYATDVQRQRDL